MPLILLHPEAVADDDRSLWWCTPPGVLGFVGAPREPPAALQHLLDDGTLESISVEPAAVRTRLGTGRLWRESGEVGAYIRSHGGIVELVSAHDDQVEVRLSGACSHCPASDVTLTERLEGGIRALHPGLRQLTAQSDPALGAGRRMLHLMPTRNR